MAKSPSPLLGFNNNVKHQGRIFHVQTEDSGVNRPHILTHLFADGGRIIKSTRTDYSEHVGRAEMSTVVRRMMKEQHKGMFIALRDGQLDEFIQKMLGPIPDAAIAAEPAAPASSASSLQGSARAPAPRRSKPPPTMPDVPAVIPAVAKAEPRPDPLRRGTAPTLTDLVLADLEASRSRGLPAGGAVGATRPPDKGGTPLLGTPILGMPGGSSRPPSGRYAASRPAAIFSSNPEQGSIFGGSTISEQSLDEVILSYLAEDLDDTADE